jgi:hypothetical protein
MLKKTVVRLNGGINHVMTESQSNAYWFSLGTKMTELVHSVPILGQPYAITRSRLSAITKVYRERYVCDLISLKELFHSIGEKLAGLQINGTPTFSFLISYSDQTHQDGNSNDLPGLSAIPIGKQTERIVMKWMVKHSLEDFENELTISVRIANPINPLVYLQAALSKTPSDLDNMEFELGFTCVTVDGATQSYADEVFLRVKNWMEARKKPHAYIDIKTLYSKYEWWIDQLSASLFPLLVIAALSFYMASKLSQPQQITATPILVGLFFLIQTIGRKFNGKMSVWAKRTDYMTIFAITNGDQDLITKNEAKARNSFLKLLASVAGNLILNTIAGIFCWWLVGA